MSIECAFHGFLAADAEARTSQAGKLWVRLRVGVGKDDAMQWVSVAVFGEAAKVAAELKKGDRVYCEGTIKLDTWRANDGAEKHSLSVAAFKIEKTHQIGRSRPQRDEQKPKQNFPRDMHAPLGSGSADPISTGRPRSDTDLSDDIPF
jgi:single-stranded DNA-binding protein